MQIERRALYNSLRMNWLQDPSLAVEPWQVEDYRALRTEQLYERLKAKALPLDRITFLSFADQADSPEQMTDDLLADQKMDPSVQDQVYLLIFELWRRLVPEKLCLSVFCDELDHEIFRCDQGFIDNPDAIADAIANLAVILDENRDEGNDPHDVFNYVCSGCANDVESFLYDFIAEQIDDDNESYAAELLDDFYGYVQDVKWFDFLKARLTYANDPELANEMVRQLVQEAAKDNDLSFNFELLGFMGTGGERDVFVKLVKQTIPLLQYEEDFQDLLSFCADFFRLLDRDQEEQAIVQILKKRAQKLVEESLTTKDPHIAELLKIVK